MCKPGVKLLVKEINKPVWDKPDETIKINLAYKSANLMVKIIPQGGAKKIDGSEAAEQQKVNDEIGKERGAVIDGSVVKIMKTNKDRAVPHTELIQKSAEMITLFKAQPQQIKMRIEDLIMKQYMRRDEKDRTKYWYVA